MLKLLKSLGRFICSMCSKGPKLFCFGLAIAIVLFAIFIGTASLFLNICNYPEFLVRRIEKSAPQGYHLQIGHMRGGAFTTLTIEDLVVTTDTSAGSLRLRAKKVQYRPTWLDMLSAMVGCGNLKVIPQYCSVAEGEISLLPNDIAIGATPSPSIELQEIAGALKCTTRNSQKNLSGKLNFKMLGVNFEVKLDIASPHKLLEYAQQQLLDRTVDSTSSAKERPITSELFADFIAKSKTIAFEDNRSSFVISLQVNDTDDDVFIYGAGNYNLSPGKINDTPLPKCSGLFTLSHHVLQINDHWFFFGANDSIKGNATVDFKSGQVSSKLTGSLYPSTALILSGNDPRDIPPWLTFTTPLYIQANLPKTHWKELFSNLRVPFHIENITACGVPIRTIAGELKIIPDSQLFTLGNLDISLDYMGRRTLNGALQWDNRQKLLAGTLEGRVDIPSLLRKLEFLPAYSPCFSGLDDASIALELAPSPLDLSRLKVEAVIGTQRYTLDEVELQDCQVHLQLDNDRLELKECSATIDTPQDIPNRLRLTAHTSLSTLMGGKETLAPFSLQLTSPRSFTNGQNQRTLSAQGTALFALDKRQIAVKELAGWIYPEALDTLLRQQFRHYTTIARCNGQEPMRFTAAMAPIDWKHWKEFTIQGELKAKDYEILSVPIAQGESHFTINNSRLAFNNITATAADGGKGTLDIAIDFDPYVFTIQRLDYRGEPQTLEPFIGTAHSRRIYRMLWEHTTWGDQPPHITISQLQYRDSTQDDSWSFTLDGHFQAHNSAYRSKKIPELSCDVSITLPDDGLAIDNLRLIGAGTKPMTGKLNLAFTPVLAGEFTVDFPEGEIDLIGILSNAAPQLTPYLRHFKAAPQTNFTCNGRFTSGYTTTIELDGSIASQRLSFQGIALDNLRGSWNYDGKHFRWDVPKAGFYNGTITTSGSHDFLNNKTDCAAITKDIPIQELYRLANHYFVPAPQPQKEKKQPTEKATEVPAIQPGMMDCESIFTLYHNWQGRPLHIIGQGQANIHDGDLWRLPMLTTLGKMVSFSTFNLFNKDKIAQLGRISSLEADFDFRGNRIHFPRIVTDGTIVALQGSGDFILTPMELDFHVTGELLKNMSVLSWALKPLSWAFEATLTGPPQSYSWNLKPKFMNFFSNGK